VKPKLGTHPLALLSKLTYPPNCFGLPKSKAPGDYLCTRR
jgi:hypothetical protein